MTEPDVNDSLRWLANQKQGRVVLQHLARTAGLFDSTFDTHNSRMSFNEGRRSIAVELFQQVRSIDEQAFTKLIGDIL